jgi:hypothetical protein
MNSLERLGKGVVVVVHTIRTGAHVEAKVMLLLSHSEDKEMAPVLGCDIPLFPMGSITITGQEDNTLETVHGTVLIHP